MTILHGASLPAFGDMTHGILLVAEANSLGARLAEDLRDYDLDIRPFASLSAALADLENKEGITNAEPGGASSSTILICAINHLAQTSPTVRQALAAAQTREGLFVLAGRHTDSATSEAARPVVVNDVLPMPLDYEEVLHRLRWHLEHRALEKRATLAEALLACIGEALMITDRHDRIVWVNGQFSDLTGYHPSEVIGKRPKFMRSSQNAPDVIDEIWLTLKRTGAWRGEIWNRRKDGEVYAEWLTVSAARAQRHCRRVSDALHRHHGPEDPRRASDAAGIARPPHRASQSRVA